MEFKITLGEALTILSALTVGIGGFFALRYQITSVKDSVTAQLEAFRLMVASYNGRLDNHAEVLKRHGADLRYHGRKIAAIEGHVFGRRVEDRMAAEMLDNEAVDREIK